MSAAQVTRRVLMVRPAAFGPNPETAATNAFAGAGGAPDLLQAAALAEFDALAAALAAAGAEPLVMPDLPVPARPDAVFPNNWVSFHEDGMVVLYPMQAASRRPERRLDLLERLAESGHISLGRLVDLSPLESRGAFLEGTGSLVLDRPRGLAYAALSARTHEAAIAEFTRRTGIRVLAFRAADEAGRPLYHTNVMLSIGARYALVCAQAIGDDRQRAAVLRELAASGREVIDIGFEAMGRFAANILEVGAGGGRSVIALSASARQALAGPAADALARLAPLLAVPVPTIERVGGGSVRCMLAEVFAPGAVP